MVVVAAHDDLVYEELKVATQAVLRGAELIGATRDSSFPMPDGQWPGTGAVLAAIETAAGVRASRIVGKPEEAMYDGRPRPARPGPNLAVGDRLDIDIAGARRAGLDSRSGAHRRHDPRRGRRRRSPPDPRRRLARRAGARLSGVRTRRGAA